MRLYSHHADVTHQLRLVDFVTLDLAIEGCRTFEMHLRWLAEKERGEAEFTANEIAMLDEFVSTMRSLLRPTPYLRAAS